MNKTRVAIDLNIRIRGNGTYTGLEDVDGLAVAGEPVEVYEPESGVSGIGCITEVDAVKRIVFLQVNWASLKAPSQMLLDSDYVQEPGVQVQASAPPMPVSLPYVPVAAA
jgi:hypothetical protein